MTKQALLQKMTELTAASPQNRVGAEIALSETVIGMKYYEAPVLRARPADDPMFEALREKKAVGPQLILPQEWLPGAKTVLSFFMPNTAPVKRANAAEKVTTPPEWLHARIEGQAFIASLSRSICAWLSEEGYGAAVPALDPRFRAVEQPREGGPFGSEAGFTSVWSERHAAFVCGMGTFGLSKGLITEKGMCGRFGSVITDAVFEYDERPYSGIYEFCNLCGSCARRCPAGAISVKSGKDHMKCSVFLDQTKITYAPRYGCGKCQVGVPCESGIPPKRAARR